MFVRKLKILVMDYAFFSSECVCKSHKSVVRYAVICENLTCYIKRYLLVPISKNVFLLFKARNQSCKMFVKYDKILLKILDQKFTNFLYILRHYHKEIPCVMTLRFLLIWQVRNIFSNGPIFTGSFSLKMRQLQ